MLVVCMEHDKYQDRPTQYYVVVKDPTLEELSQLKLRQMFNAELRYFVTKLDNDYTEEEVLKLFRQQWARKAPNFVEIGR